MRGGEKIPKGIEVPRSSRIVIKSNITHPRRDRDILRAETGPETARHEQESLPKTDDQAFLSSGNLRDHSKAD
eukprot:3472453-Pyramimonas_sp.AAC.1